MSDGRSQLIGALGEWLEASPDDASSADRTRATQLILDTSLLGVRTVDIDACKAINLDAQDTALLARVRAWAYPDDPAVITSSEGNVDDEVEGGDVDAADSGAVVRSDDKARSSDDPDASDASEVVDLRDSSGNADGDMATNTTGNQFVGAAVSDGAAAAFEAAKATEPAVANQPGAATPPLGIVASTVAPERSSFQAREMSPAPPEWLHDKRAFRRKWLNEEAILITICLIAVVVLIIRQLVG